MITISDENEIDELRVEFSDLRAKNAEIDEVRQIVLNVTKKVNTLEDRIEDGEANERRDSGVVWKKETCMRHYDPGCKRCAEGSAELHYKGLRYLCHASFG